MRTNKEAFSLLEVAIVMVIIGLIVAGVVGARDIIRQSKLASIVKDVEEFKAAIRDFEDKFNNLPGDMPDAFDYWGNACGGDSSAPGGCNGDNDDAVEDTEDLRAWQHLSLAGLLKQTYSGTGPDPSVNVNIPGTIVSPAGGFMLLSEAIHGRTDNTLLYAEINTASNPDSLENAIITASEAWAIDRKYDDGIPTSGQIMARDGNGVTGCINTTPNPDIYVLDPGPTDADTSCRMNFWLVPE